MSSRNQYLTAAQRQQAVALSQALDRSRHAVRRSRRGLRAANLKRTLVQFIERQPEARVDYIEFFDPQTLQPVTEVKRGVQLALAVFIGATRLIDNGRL